MRDLIIVLIVFGTLPFALTRPYIGLLLWSWLGYMNPNRLAWGFAYNFPFVMVAALATFVGLMLTKEKKRLPMTGVTVLWLIWIMWFCITTPFALNPDLAQPEFARMIKIQTMVGVTLLIMGSRERLTWLIWVIVVSIGFFGVKGGMFVLATGGNYMVWGPPDSFISGNNEMALALLVIIPLMRYLQMNDPRPWVRKCLMGAMVLCTFSVLGSYSRGAFVGAGAMLAVLWLRSRKKFVILIPVAAICGLALAFMPPQWFERMGTIKTYDQDASALGRINAWGFAWNVARDRPVLGGGFRSFSAEQFQRYAPNPNDVHDAHSIYFEVLAEQGWVGLGIFLSLSLATLFLGSRIIKLTKKRDDLKWAHDLAAMLQVSFAGFGIGGAFLGLAYFDLPYHLMAIMILTYSVVRTELKGATALEPVTGPAANANVYPAPRAITRASP